MHLRVCFLHQSQDMHNSEQTIWGKTPEEYNQYPSHTDIEKHCVGSLEPSGVHCTKLVRIHVSAHEGY